MYVIREVLHCKPGQVRQIVERFKGISSAMTDMGHEPLRLLTDVAGEPFWTLVAEARVHTIEDFLVMERRLMANESLRQILSGFHDLIEQGRREIYRIES